MDRVYFLTSGLVSARVPFESGHEIECVLGGRNTVIGAMAALGLDASVTRVVSLFDAKGWSMPVASLRAAVVRSPAIEQVMQVGCHAQMSFAVLVGACNAVHGAERRLARWLVLADDLMNGEDLPLRQEDLSMSLGLQRSAVNPVLQRLQADGLISVGRGRIGILDAHGLAERACSCHRTLERVAWTLPKP